MQSICGQVHWLKKPVLAYGKNMPRNNQFSVFCPEKIKYYPEKNLLEFLKNLPQKTKIYPVTESPRWDFKDCYIVMLYWF